MNHQKHKRIIISGGGTGGHVFPAISVANALRRIDPDIEILFVGAEGRMEMEKVPEAEYKIVGLPVAGFYRSLTTKNFVVLYKLVTSLFMARKIISEFQPDVVVGVGGYASGPVLRQAGKMGIPMLIQEQNSYAGVTNKLLAKKASVMLSRICSICFRASISLAVISCRRRLIFRCPSIRASSSRATNGFTR